MKKKTIRVILVAALAGGCGGKKPKLNFRADERTPAHTLEPQCQRCGAPLRDGMRLIAMLNIALGNAQPSPCPHGVPSLGQYFLDSLL